MLTSERVLNGTRNDKGNAKKPTLRIHGKTNQKTHIGLILPRIIPTREYENEETVQKIP